MSKFIKLNQFDVIREDSPSIKNRKKEGSIQITKVSLDETHQVNSFKLDSLNQGESRRYEKFKNKFGSLAATDTDRVIKNRKDARFSISPLLRTPLSVEEEERRVIEERVRVRVTAITDEARKKAETEGFQEGYKKGYEEAFQKFREDGTEKLKQFDDFLNYCEKAKEEIFKANEQFLIRLIYRISRMILLRELQSDREYLFRLTSDLISRVGVRENISVKIHPDDLKIAAALKDNLEKVLGSMKNLNIDSSTQVKQGGCIVETEWNAIDAGIDTQLSGLFETLVGASKDNEKEIKDGGSAL